MVVMPEWNTKIYDLTLLLRAKVPVQLERKPYDGIIVEEGCADLAQRFGRLNQLSNYICSYNCIHEDLGLIIENINNEKINGEVKVMRTMDGL